MIANQYTLATGCLAGVSFLLHLISAGNFLPDEEVWFLGTVFWYMHYWLNMFARMLLLSASVMLGMEIYKPNMISSYASINATRLKGYLLKMLSVATICIFVRFITPGPVTSFGFLYKLCFMTSLSAAVITVVEDGGASVGNPFKKRLGMKKREYSEDDIDQDESIKRRLGRPKNSPSKSFKDN